MKVSNIVAPALASLYLMLPRKGISLFVVSLKVNADGSPGERNPIYRTPGSTRAASTATPWHRSLPDCRTVPWWPQSQQRPEKKVRG